MRTKSDTPMDDGPDQEPRVEAKKGTLGKAERMTPQGLASRANLPGVSPRHLDERQAALGERRKPAGPPLQDRSRAEAAVEAPVEEEVPDVPATECEDPPGD